MNLSRVLQHLAAAIRHARYASARTVRKLRAALAHVVSVIRSRDEANALIARAAA